MDIWTMIQQYVDPVAVFVSLLFTEIIVCYVPGAKAEGTWQNRIMPFVPLIIGMVVCGVQATSWYPLGWAMKGLTSGGAAAYARRTYKVTVLGL